MTIIEYFAAAAVTGCVTSFVVILLKKPGVFFRHGEDIGPSFAEWCQARAPKLIGGADVVRLLHELVAFVAGEHTGCGADGRYFVAAGAVLLDERRTAAVGINDYDYDNEKS